jgi:hypothetical protein
MAATAPTVPATETCPRCRGELGAGQDWCLECGLAAHTVVSPAPRWRWPIAGAALVAVAALAAIAVAFVALTGKDAAPVTTTAASPTTSTPTGPAPPTPVQVKAAAAQLLAVKVCLGAGANAIPVFQPSVQYAESESGGVSAARFGHAKLEVLVLPTPAIARAALANARQQLAAFQAQRPSGYAKLRARIDLPRDNVVRIVSRGPITVDAAKAERCVRAG